MLAWMTLHGSVFSQTLGFSTGISVLTPDKILEKGSYRVAYLLHGLYGDHYTWFNNTMMAGFAAAYDTVFVMPEAARSFYTNQQYGYNYYTYIAEELPKITQAVFNVSSKRDDTAIIGCSMGGYGALKIALPNPECYGFCAALSPAFLFINEILAKLKTDGIEWAAKSPSNAAILRDIRAIFGENLAHKNSDIIFKLAETASLSKTKTKLFVTCGTEDNLIGDARRFNGMIQEAALNLDWIFEETDGAHDWVFFSKALQKALDIWKK
ncbi:MAG: esterase family protein [Spirochaetaceae bacterium]|jgi:S-formylglutathione hydrolase FrmB|nr:esterase family protein [Spirochaetaceae bacterium]